MIALPEWALTLHQPWCWLCANGFKTLENRPPGFSNKSFRGDFWLHAGLKADRGIYDAARALTDQVLTGINRVTLPPFSKFHTPQLPLGYIIGRATIVGVLPVATPGELPDGWRMVGRFAFMLENAVALARPVKARGFQGFWRVPAPVIEQLREAA